MTVTPLWYKIGMEKDALQNSAMEHSEKSAETRALAAAGATKVGPECCDALVRAHL